MRVFVTGATGLLGNTIVRQLLEEGDRVTVLVRSEPAEEVFRGLDVEQVHGDLDPIASDEPGQAHGHPDSELSSWQRELAECDAVIHSAGLIHLGWNRMDESMRVNRDGTQRIVDACLRAGKRLVYVGTVNTLAVGSRQTWADETTPLDFAGGQIPCAYVQSKRAAVKVVGDAVDRGLNAVTVHPGFMLGPWDWKPSSGRMMLEVGRGWKPIAPRGGCSLCDARDVAAGTVAAMRSSCPPGRHFVLAGHNLTYQQLWTAMAKRMGTRPPIRAAGPGAEYLAGLVGDLSTRFRGRESDINSAATAMSGQFHWYCSRRAEQELGYCYRDAEETLDAAGDWIRERFVLPRSEPAG